MKTFVKIFLLYSALMLTGFLSEAQIVVRVRPTRPAVVVRRPAAPSPRHVWVEEDWVPRGRRYTWHGGYWVTPPRPRAVWVPGHWEGRRRGQVWIQGYWR
ncbi:MAG: hypothetical protein QM669_01465 [Siphonobacter sp.]